MSKILEHIHQDHKNMICLLDLLENELRDLASGADHDYTLMANVVDYFSHYPAHYHHPFEDKVFEWIGNKRASLAAEIGGLREQHESQSKLVVRLSTLMKGVQAGHMVPRDEIAELMEEFIKVQRAHIDSEESHILKEAECILAGLHLAEIPIPDRASLDPLFGDEINPDYAVIAVALGRGGHAKAMDSGKPGAKSDVC